MQLSFLKTQSEKLNEEIFGIKILKLISEQESELIDKVILEKLSLKYKKKSHRFFTIILSIVSMTFGGLYQAIIQDVLLTDIIKEILCKSIGAFCI